MTRNTLREAKQGELLERAIVRALLEVTDDLRLTVRRDELWPMVYARVACTEAEFWSTMNTVVRILKGQLEGKRAQSPAHLTVVS